MTNDNFARRADNSFYTNELSGLTPTLKLSGILTLNKKAKSLIFNVGPEGKKGLTAFLGLTSVKPMVQDSGYSTFQLSARFRMFRSPGHEYIIIGGISYD
ncbi:MAG: hypothetical protein EA359_02845 [Balneolaceae bacterium]|nr:MAG: hypothetical protein EA359_02845 [Balneolaceae bacterium]